MSILTAILLATIVSLVLLLLVGLMIGVIRERRIHRSNSGSAAAISIIVAARNEESSLPLLVESLVAQSRQDFGIVFWDDASEDGTYRVMSEARERLGEARVTIHRAGTVPIGKKAALERCLEMAIGDVYLLTDADCILPPTWVDSLATCFLNPRVGLVYGVASVRPDGTLLAAYQTFDQLARCVLAFWLSGFKVFVGGFGNNMAIRRSALEAIGGYGAVPFSVTEDAALIQAIAERKEYDVVGIARRESVIEVVPEETWRDRHRQAVRWAHGAVYSPDLATRFIYLTILGLMTVLLIGPIFASVASVLIFSPLIPLSIVSVIGVMGFAMGRIRSPWYWIGLPFLAFLFCIAYVGQTILSLGPKPVEWKGRQLQNERRLSTGARPEDAGEKPSRRRL